MTTLKILIWLKKHWTAVALILALITAGSMLFRAGYNSGEAEARSEYSGQVMGLTARMAEQQHTIDLQNTGVKIALERTKAAEAQRDLAQVLLKQKQERSKQREANISKVQASSCLEAVQKVQEVR